MYSDAQAVTSSQFISKTGKLEIQKYRSSIRSEFILLIKPTSQSLILFCTNNGFPSCVNQNIHLILVSGRN
jgi:hypothetical protein